MRFLGIDPGTATTGYGVIDVNGDNSAEPVDYGHIKTDKLNLMSHRLVKIYDHARHLVEKHSPDAIIIERLFFNTNVKTAITVGQSRGLFILIAGQYNIPVFEYTALQAKMLLTGYGRAEKEKVREKVAEMLNIKTTIKPIDASDALAMALCHLLKGGNVTESSD